MFQNIYDILIIKGLNQRGDEMSKELIMENDSVTLWFHTDSKIVHH